MSAAQKLMDNPDHPVSNDAHRRIASARVRDMSYRLKTIIGDRHIEGSDLEMLAQAILRAIDDNPTNLTRESVISNLIDLGRARSKAEHLVSLVLR